MKYQSERLKQTIEKILEKLVIDFNPQKIVLYGSYAFGNPGEESDIDFFIVYETSLPFFKRLLSIRKAISNLRNGFPLDLLALTPKEVEERIKMGDKFIDEILRKGVILYEK